MNCQYIIRKPGSTFSWDAGRTARFGLLGFVLIAPCTHFWYGWLAQTFPGTGALAIAKRVAFDQLVYAPTFIPAFFMSVKLLEGTAFKQSADDLIAQFPDIYKTNLLGESKRGAKRRAKKALLRVSTLNADTSVHNVATINPTTVSNYVAINTTCFISSRFRSYAVWVPASTINFAFVPVKYMVLFGNVVGLFWNTYLSFVSNSKKEEDGEEMKEEL